MQVPTLSSQHCPSPVTAYKSIPIDAITPRTTQYASDTPRTTRYASNGSRIHYNVGESSSRTATAREQVSCDPPAEQPRKPKLCWAQPPIDTPQKAVLDIGGRTFDVMRELGRGAFGVVWEARERKPAGQLLAYKRTFPTGKTAFESALFEVEVLRKLTDCLPPGCPAASRAPRYFAHGLPEGGHTVNLAMSKVAGQPTARWLYGLEASEMLEADAYQMFRRPADPMQRSQSTQSIAEAGTAAATLLSQLAPVMAALSTIALHRDISAYNVLVDAQGHHGRVPGRWDFFLIDFGLAVCSKTWSRVWRTSNTAGDPRYWSPAAWMNLTYGSTYLADYPDQSYRRQYENRLDHFPFGVLVLEVLFGLWVGPALEGGNLNGVLASALAEAYEAWLAYWFDAYSLYQEFHNGSGIRGVRCRLVRSTDLATLLDHMGSLCLSLRSASRQARRASKTSLAAVLWVGCELLDANGTLSWDQIPAALEKGWLDLSSSSSSALPQQQPPSGVELSSQPTPQRAPLQAAARAAAVDATGMDVSVSDGGERPWPAPIPGMRSPRTGHRKVVQDEGLCFNGFSASTSAPLSPRISARQVSTPTTPTSCRSPPQPQQLLKPR